MAAYFDGQRKSVKFRWQCWQRIHWHWSYYTLVSIKEIIWYADNEIIVHRHGLPHYFAIYIWKIYHQYGWCVLLHHPLVTRKCQTAGSLCCAVTKTTCIPINIQTKWLLHFKLLKKVSKIHTFLRTHWAHRCFFPLVILHALANLTVSAFYLDCCE